MAVEILWHRASIFRKPKRLGPQPNLNGFTENITPFFYKQSKL